MNFNLIARVSILLVGILFLNLQTILAQSWVTVSTDNFNNLSYESCYASGGDTYWANCNTSNPRNSLINGSWEITNTTLGSTQTPSDALGGRFLMYWTNADRPTADTVFFRKTITNAIVGQVYRVSFKVGNLNSNNPRAALSLRRVMNGTSTVIYSESDATFPGTSWTTVSSAGSGTSGASTMQFTATATSFTLQWINTQITNSAGSGNDFAIDDVLIESLSYSVTGTVYNDNNGTTGGADGTGLANVPVALYSGDGLTVIANTTTNASGVYTFSNTLPGNYNVVVTPLSGYRNVSSTDATPTDGSTAVTVSNTAITGVNFGINQPPTANAVSQTIAQPTTFQIAQGTITQAVSGNDPGVGTLTTGSTVVIKALPSNGILRYNGTAVTQDMVITNFSSTNLSFTNLNGGTTSTGFGYTFIDGAGLEGTSAATFTVQWTGALPVKWGTVNVKLINNNQAFIAWTTTSELNNRGFFVEYSKDGINWVNIGFEASKGIDGNTSTLSTYSFTHNVIQHINYYRLKQVDLDGTFEYSKVYTLKIDLLTNGFTVFPNPATDILYFHTAAASEIQYIKLTDISGRLVKKIEQKITSINMADLPRGIYILNTVFKNGTQKVEKIRKQ